MPPAEQIHPLKDVWLRPRRVFRELAARPIGITDYLLAAAQGVATSIAVYRTQLAGTHASAAQIVNSAVIFGPLGGLLSVYVFTAIYGRLGKRAGGTAARNQLFHVLAYGGVPIAASLLLWMLTALLIGEAAFTAAPGAAPSSASAPGGGETDGVVTFVLGAQFAVYLLLTVWSVVLQVMGLSEIFNLSVRKAFGVWGLGQVLALLGVLILGIFIAVLFPGAVPTPP